jgi:hypothetical protein
MRTPMIAALLFAAAAAPALASPQVSFDQGVDVSAIVSQTKAAVRKDKAQTPFHAMRYDMDCASVAFGANDKPVSDRVWLRSQEWETRCTPVGDPRHGGGQNCWEQPGMSWSQGVQITLQGRGQVLPWERDVFRVCMNGPWVYVDPILTTHKYHETGSDATGDYVESATARTLQAPDPAGILGSVTPQFQATFTDKWASYYPGETVTLKIELKKDVPIFPDSTLLKKEITLPVAASYSVDLNKYAAEFSQKAVAGKKYYLRYSIRRDGGTVSTKDYTDELETAKVSYAPAALAFAR